MQKSSGTYELVLWGEAFASQTTTPVTVDLGTTYPTANIYDITTGTTPLNSYSNASSVTVNLSDHAVIVEFGGSPKVGTPTATATTSPTPTAVATVISLRLLRRLLEQPRHRPLRAPLQQ